MKVSNITMEMQYKFVKQLLQNWIAIDGADQHACAIA